MVNQASHITEVDLVKRIVFIIIFVTFFVGIFTYFIGSTLGINANPAYTQLNQSIAKINVTQTNLARAFTTPLFAIPDHIDVINALPAFFIVIADSVWFVITVAINVVLMIVATFGLIAFMLFTLLPSLLAVSQLGFLGTIFTFLYGLMWVVVSVYGLYLSRGYIIEFLSALHIL